MERTGAASGFCCAKLARYENMVLKLYALMSIVVPMPAVGQYFSPEEQHHEISQQMNPDWMHGKKALDQHNQHHQKDRKYMLGHLRECIQRPQAYICLFLFWDWVAHEPETRRPHSVHANLTKASILSFCKISNNVDTKCDLGLHVLALE